MKSVLTQKERQMIATASHKRARCKEMPDDIRAALLRDLHLVGLIEGSLQQHARRVLPLLGIAVAQHVDDGAKGAAGGGECERLEVARQALRRR